MFLQEWYESKDGTRVPMFIVRHKDTPFDGTAAAIQYGALPVSALPAARGPSRPWPGYDH